MKMEVKGNAARYSWQLRSESLRTPFFAAKSAHSHVIPWLIDWLGKRCLHFFLHFFQKGSEDGI